MNIALQRALAELRVHPAFSVLLEEIEKRTGRIMYELINASNVNVLEQRGMARAHTSLYELLSGRKAVSPTELIYDGVAEADQETGRG